MQSHALESLALRAQAEQIADRYTPHPGRPSTLTEPDTVQVLLAAIADGNYRETACKLAGISKVTFYNWLKQAEAGNEQAIAFVNALEKAEALAESQTVRNVRKASELPQFWAAGMTWLERKSPERWGKRQEDGGGPKVVVQIGARESDVTINVLSPSVSPDLHSLSARETSDQGLIIRNYVNQRESVPGTDEATVALDPAGDPAGEGMAPIRRRASGLANRARKGKRA